ncbi:MAG: endonuclease MutS2 [Clostridia bacterium]|nr:endonuclease MutS2 [Clostridia bacterium]
METKYFEKLEFNQIKKILESFCVTFLGRKLALELLPLASKAEIEKAGNQTFEAANLIYRKGSLPVSEIEDITKYLKSLEAENPLNAKAILDLATILRIARSLKNYFFNEEIDMSEFSNLTNLFENLYANPGIEEKVFSAIIDEETIADDASSNLKTIRKNIKNKEQEIRNKLNSMLHQKFVQEPIVTLRADRFVIPVKAEYKSEVKGFVHDISSSGSTLFIEPISVFELNNEIGDLKFQETLEIQKILERLSSLFFEITDELENDRNLIGLIDFIFAKGKYANSIDASLASISDEKEINLQNAWHPLLEKDKAVKNNIYLGKEFQALIITGPNTGGKTVALKTTGLIVLMAMSGLMIPAKEGSKIFAFDNVFADIGDEQSIQESLSTFSSHMSNIASILEKATTNSLVLLDELGSGTDPQEGASLAISILEELKSRGTLTISTTHYPELKNFAIVTDGFENACVEFDIKKLLPTYKLLIGIPGTSNAFAISKRLGISEEIIARAKEKLNNTSVHIEDLLKEIYEDKRVIESEKEKAIKNAQETQTIKQELEKRNNELKNKENSIVLEAKEKASKILQEAKEDADDLIKAIENATSSKEANQKRKELNKKIEENSFSSTPKPTKLLKKEDFKIGDQVFVPRINQSGTIISLSSDNAMVQMGIIKSSFQFSELELKATPIPKEDKLRSVKREFKPISISPEINVIGQNVDEACFAIDKYLDTCFLNGLKQVRIVHGKGTGKLRTGVQAFLKTHPHVKSFRLGTFGEGEMGVTVVELK